MRYDRWFKKTAATLRKNPFDFLRTPGVLRDEKREKPGNGKRMIHFFIGKGGVGKSTTSALSALKWSREKRRVLLVSMDPAHNQRDIFSADFSEKETRINSHLWVKEIDLALWVKCYIEETRRRLRQTYAYHSAFNLEKHFGIFQFAPGLEEHALLLAFENMLDKAGDKDVIVVDMPPSALTLRFFSMPFTSLSWLNELLGLRTEICAKKEIIANIEKKRPAAEPDRVKRKLDNLVGDYEKLRDGFLCSGNRINLVMNPDKLSFSEAIRVRRKLEDIGLSVNRIIVNKAAGQEDSRGIGRSFSGIPLTEFPLESGGLDSPDRLDGYLDKNVVHFPSR